LAEGLWTIGWVSPSTCRKIQYSSRSDDIHRVIAAVSVDGARFADIHDLRVTATTTNPATEYVFQPASTVEIALVCLEIYRRDGTWHLRAVGQGYNDGLASLACDFGVDMA
jgi:stress response protein SCP2